MIAARWITIASLLLVGCSALHQEPPPLHPGAAADAAGFEIQFNLPRESFVSAGRNDYFILEPGYQHTYKGEDEELTITVLEETKLVDGVETRVVEERESADGKVVEVSR